MEKLWISLICASLLTAGCGGREQTIKTGLETGLPRDEILSLWGKPEQQLVMGRTSRNDYLVEVWAYYETSAKNKPADEYLLILVDGELFKMIKNDPQAMLAELASLGVLPVQPEEFGLSEYQRHLRESAEKAVQTQRSLDVIRTFQQYDNTRLQIESYKQMRILQQQQQQLRPPPIPPPQRPRQPAQ